MERAIDRKPRNWIAARKLPLLTAYFRGPKLVPLPIWPPKPRSDVFFGPLMFTTSHAMVESAGSFESQNPFSCRSNGGIISDSVTPRHHRRLKALNVISQLNYGEGISGVGAIALAAKLQVGHAHIGVRGEPVRCITRWSLHKKIASADAMDGRT